MRRRRALAIALAALALTACSTAGGGSAGSDPPGSATPSPAPVVSLQQSGGFAGSRDEVIVQPDGTWRRTVRVGGTTIGTLSADRRDQLTRMAADPMLRAEATRTAPKSGCADAFDYSLTVGTIRIAWRDCGPATEIPTTASRIARFLLENTNST